MIAATVTLPVSLGKTVTTIVFVDQEEDKAYSFDTLTGEKEPIAVLPKGSWWSFYGVLQNRWLVGTRNNTIVNLDLQNGLTIVGSYPGMYCRYSSITLSLDGPGAIPYLYNDCGSLQTLRVNESTGKFNKVNEFRFPDSDSIEGAFCRGTIGPHVFLEMNHYYNNASDEAFLIAQSMTNGCAQYLRFPPNRRCGTVPFYAQSNGKEIFVCIEPRDPKTRSDCGVEIAVYSARLTF